MHILFDIQMSPGSQIILHNGPYLKKKKKKHGLYSVYGTLLKQKGILKSWFRETHRSSTEMLSRIIHSLSVVLGEDV